MCWFLGTSSEGPAEGEAYWSLDLREVVQTKCWLYAAGIGPVSGQRWGKLAQGGELGKHVPVGAGMYAGWGPVLRCTQAANLPCDKAAREIPACQHLSLDPASFCTGW